MPDDQFISSYAEDLASAAPRWLRRTLVSGIAVLVAYTVLTVLERQHQPRNCPRFLAIFDAVMNVTVSVYVVCFVAMFVAAIRDARAHIRRTVPPTARVVVSSRSVSPGGRHLRPTAECAPCSDA